MITLNYDSPAGLKAFLEQRGFSMQKKFGQNFLINPATREKIVTGLGLKVEDRVWEIGPGLGSLTHRLAAITPKLTVFEIDHGFIEMLGQLFPDRERVKIVPGDFLRTWQGELGNGMPDVVCGNLPYNAASAFIADFAETRFAPRLMLFTVQKEAAERMRASPDTANYSSFSVLCQAMYRVKLEFTVGPGCFWPQPDVTSAVVSFTPRTDFPPLKNHARFLEVTRAIFSSRRKTIENNLKKSGLDAARIDAALARCSIPASLRAESLSPERIAELSDALEEGLAQ
jgi:16S rRNA (adenine1518-N6/adenine1519-N6)-dimethyltransferase